MTEFNEYTDGGDENNDNADNNQTPMGGMVLALAVAMKSVIDIYIARLKFLIYSVLVWYLVVFVIAWFQPLDDTDDTDTGTRSNMAIKIDHQTKCQYLSTAEGGLTPRLNTLGEHYGCKS